MLRGLLPRELVEVALEQADLAPEQPAGTVRAAERKRLRHWLKHFRLTVSGHRPLAEAIVTAGGVDTREVDPRTMGSRLVSGSSTWPARCSTSRPTPAATTSRPPFPPAGWPGARRRPGWLIPGHERPIPARHPAEMAARGWDALDVILVTGDAYIDSPFMGVAVIGRVLVQHGFRVGVIAQPAMDSAADLTRLGEPRLFWGVTGGSIDSMVANRTASGLRRKADDYTPGGRNDRRPDRAVIAYANLIRRCCKQTAPIVLGGIEASLRRIAHYDAWDNRVRRSILFDAKADYLLYGMAERSVVELARRWPRASRRPRSAACATLPPNRRPGPRAGRLCRGGGRPGTVHCHVPHLLRPLRPGDRRDARPAAGHALPGPQPAAAAVRRGAGRGPRPGLHPRPPPDRPEARPGGALDTIRFALTTHRGCYGECNFCAIAVHQGRTVQSRSPASIVREAGRIAAHPDFRGTLTDVGGPTANMYGFERRRKATKGACADKRCLYPAVCPGLRVDHGPLLDLLRRLRQVRGCARWWSPRASATT